MVTSSDHAIFTSRVLDEGARPVLLVSVDGDVDRANEGTLRELVAASATVGAVVVDLRHAWFVSSSVYGCLLDEGARLGLRIRLVVPTEGVARRTLRALGLTAEFDVHADPTSATAPV